ncbi:kinase-like domain-containing protein [Apiosordaria backusii]|uniref:Kinase-like domain-containing protein n=1 Tax=Apiosordaria backusii TaxID=314023 RepID=A0AA40ASW2_9PEZI|nr:kinase-like domain-containing protein [Apiosordaria backusii]
MGPIIAFRNAVPSLLALGFDSYGSAGYVPYSKLQDYWSTCRIREVLNSCNVQQRWELPDTIHKRFLRLFSTLVYATAPEACMVKFMSHFVTSGVDDSNLPLDTYRPKHEDCVGIFPNERWQVKGWVAFDKHQYLFSPVRLGEVSILHNTSLMPRSILPWRPGPILMKGKYITAQKYFLNEDSELYSKAPTVLVRTTRLENREVESSFTNKIASYLALEPVSVLDSASKYFLEYYGSFRHDGWGYVLLEHADEGILENFYTQHDSETPLGHSELYGLWEAMSNLLNGLALLHSFNRDRTGTLLGIHRDLRPYNIYVSRAHDRHSKPEDGTKSSWKYRFKIRDFGMSGFGPDQILWHNTKGVTEFQAPELAACRAEFRDHGSNLTPKADIWSLGCIFLEMLVWSISGEHGQMQFKSIREKSGSFGAFHNVTTTLDLDKILRQVLSRRLVFDKVSEPVADLILGSMLCLDPKKRDNAVQLSSKLRTILEKLKREDSSSFSTRDPGPKFGATTLEICEYRRVSVDSDHPEPKFGATPLEIRDYSRVPVDSDHPSAPEPTRNSYDRRTSYLPNPPSGYGQGFSSQLQATTFSGRGYISQAPAPTNLEHGASKSPNLPPSYHQGSALQQAPGIDEIGRKVSGTLDEVRERMRVFLPDPDAGQPVSQAPRTTRHQSSTFTLRPQPQPIVSSYIPVGNQQNPDNRRLPANFFSLPLPLPSRCTINSRHTQHNHIHIRPLSTKATHHLQKTTPKSSPRLHSHRSRNPSYGRSSTGSPSGVLTSLVNLGQPPGAWISRCGDLFH